MYRYIFAVTGREVVEESLAEMRPVSDRVFFSRTSGAEGSEQVFNLDWWERRVVPEEERMFAKFVAKGTKPNQLFLHEAMDRNVTVLAPVFRWFRDQLVVLGPNDDYLSLRVQEAERQDLRDFTVSILNRADTGIVGIEAVDVPVAGIGMPKQVQDELRSTLKEDDAGIILRSDGGARFRVFPKDGELMARRIVTYTKLAIEDTLDAGLPRAYTPEIYRQKCSAVFEHVYEAYPEQNAGVYAQAVG